MSCCCYGKMVKSVQFCWP